MREELENVQITLNAAAEYNLQAEVILFAMLALKRNPYLTIDEALNEGSDEWIK